MKIRFQLLLLLGCLVALFAAAATALYQSQRREAGTVAATSKQQRTVMADRVLELMGQSLDRFASDYSLWDEMVEFVQSRDRDWAKINIEPSLSNFDVQSVWVLQADGALVYQTGELAATTPADLPFAQPAFHDRLRRARMMHFYLETPAGLLEVRTSPIQPSNDTARTSEPRGWLIAARVWNEPRLEALANLLQSQVTFTPNPSGSSASIRSQRTLIDWNGQQVRTLHITFESFTLTQVLQGNRHEIYVLVCLSVTMLVVTGVSLSRWISTPLQKLSHSLETGQTGPLQSLRGKRNEFAHLARLVEQSFTQRAALEREVGERRRMAEALQETSGQLRESVELQSRLGRDLHDGVIQSIYAAGLGIEGVRGLLHTDPAAAERRLVGSLAALNNTIRDVRAFINGLESEATVTTLPFQQTLATLVATMQAVQPGHIELQVDEAVARRISPAQELQILHVLREAVSNALRHADPQTIRLSLGASDGGQAELKIADDGCGFQPAAPASRGRGLVNLGIRAREMGGSLEIDSAPGKGTRITLRFHPTYPP